MLRSETVRTDAMRAETAGFAASPAPAMAARTDTPFSANTALYERMHALPSEIVCWHAENYSEAIRRTGRPRDEAKIFVKDVAEWSGLMQEQIERVLPFLGGAPHD